MRDKLWMIPTTVFLIVIYSAIAWPAFKEGQEQYKKSIRYTYNVKNNECSIIIEDDVYKVECDKYFLLKAEIVVE